MLLVSIRTTCYKFSILETLNGNGIASICICFKLYRICNLSLYITKDFFDLLYFYTKDLYNDWFTFWANSFEIIIYDDKCNRNNAQMSAKIAMLMYSHVFVSNVSWHVVSLSLWGIFWTNKLDDIPFKIVSTPMTN